MFPRVSRYSITITMVGWILLSRTAKLALPSFTMIACHLWDLSLISWDPLLTLLVAFKNLNVIGFVPTVLPHSTMTTTDGLISLLWEKPKRAKAKSASFAISGLTDGKTSQSTLVSTKSPSMTHVR